MKRNKIRKKYLNSTVTSLSPADSKLEKTNLLNKIEQKMMKIFIFLGLIFLLFIWGSISIIIFALLGFDYNTFTETTKIIFLLISDLLFLGILCTIYRKTLITDFKKFFGGNWWGYMKQALTYWAVGLVIMYFSNLIIAIITNGAIASNEEAVRKIIDVAPWYMTFQLMIYAPFSEELIFRKSIFDISKNKYLYVITSGLIFGGLHVLPSLTSTIELLYLIPYCSLGFAFALLYRRSNNIFSTITVHAIHNSLALVLYLISGGI